MKLGPSEICLHIYEIIIICYINIRNTDDLLQVYILGYKIYVLR